MMLKHVILAFFYYNLNTNNSLVIDIRLPVKYVNDIELEGSAQELELHSIKNEKLECKGSVDKVICKNIKSHVELDLDIFLIEWKIAI